MSVKLIFASDSYKGSLTQRQICDVLTRSATAVFSNPACLPMVISDGGEGALDAIIEVTNGKILSTEVNDPLFNKIQARYGVFKDTAVVSMSEASGLTLVPDSLKNPLNTTTFGTGELIKKAIFDGYKKVVITIGGSATNDGGMGALIALGAIFTLKNGSLAKGVGGELGEVQKIDLSPLNKYSDVEFIVLSDVQNTLTGDEGCAKVFARQKGATDEIIDALEEGMKNYEAKVFEALGQEKCEIKGGGAAGGLGFGLKTCLNATVLSGIEYVLDLNDYDSKLEGATCVITGEGRIDSQTAYGKVISGIINRAKAKGVPVFAIVGSVGKGAEELYNHGLNGIYSIIDTPNSLENILADSEKLYEKTALSLFNTIKSLI